MEKMDFAKTLKHLYTAGAEAEEVVAERGVFLCMDGRGEPVGDDYQQTVDLLQTVARALRARLARAGRADFKTWRIERRWMCDPKPRKRNGAGV